ncbi:hypothetical protein B5F79_06290 [Olsenella sp. An285]|uniref:L,D-transpeptidase family protein n=1 Tax=Olsenella sp. An285 TaxID=1965621 RepID=UPI000B36BB99|nr:L,D-transpeptidase family protein [Olsenella sp. An285]OUO46797.1 hypothetical protein B5F79_06290 [Olsenella sp. An285]
MQLFKDKKPSVVAGLVAALTFGGALVATPSVALAQGAETDGAIVEQTSESGAETPETDATVTTAALSVKDDSAGTVVQPSSSSAVDDVTSDVVDVVVDDDATDVIPSGDASAPSQGGADADAGTTPVIDEDAASETVDRSDEISSETDGAKTAPEPGSDIEPEVAEEPSDPEADEVVEGDDAVGGDDAVVSETAESSDAVDSAAELQGDAELAAEDEADAEAVHVNTWVSDGKGSYVWYGSDGAIQSGWLVTDVAVDNSKGGLQRYWLSDAGSAVMGLFEAAIDGVTSWFFGTQDGYVARGAYTDSETGYVYLADNEGRLADTGWVCTDAYGHGFQRYWVDEEAHACIPGVSEDGWAHYTTEKGYVLRGNAVTSDGAMRSANNDGLLQKSGWLVTSAFGQGLQRYWVDDYEVAKDRLITSDEAGWNAYATSEGYVVRGGSIASDGTMRYADNDGRLQESGWLVTSAFGQGLQRYWLEAFQVVKDRFISAAQAGWEAYATDKGYVLRGSLKYGDGVLLANNDGALESGTGWIVTDAYGNGIQRYYLSRSKDGSYSYATTGYFQADLGSYRDAWFYGDTSRGYVVRGKTKVSGGLVLSNNEGILVETLLGSSEGFRTTDLFDSTNQVYYLDRVNGHLIARTGVFSVGSKKYFGRPNEGYIVRGKTTYGGGMIIAASDGALYFQDVNGFVVTAEVDGELQRYYIVDLGDGVRGAKLGLFTVGNDQYYGREDQGYVVRGQYTTPDGMLIQGDGDGKITYSFLTRAGWAAWDKVKNFSGGMYSLTQYLLTVDTTNNRVVVFQGTYIPSLGWYGNWTPLYDWSCSTGNKIYHGGDGTPTGIYRIGGNADYNWNESGNYTPGGYRTTYWAINDVTYFTGFLLNLGFHSTVGYQGGYSDANQLGKHITHGCIRLAEDCAKWIYYNALPGTKVYVF